MAEAKKMTKKAKDETPKKAIKRAEVVAEVAPIEGPPEAKLEMETVEKPTPAKAGKRSPKAAKEAEAKKAKTERKETTTPEKTKNSPKPSAKAPRSRAQRAGKKYRKASKQVEKDKTYPLTQAIDLALKTNTTSFNAAVEMHINLGVDPKQADQNIRGTVILPAGTGKELRIAVLADEVSASKAKKAGASLSGLDNILAELDKQNINFDILITQPQLMPRLAKYAKLLGPRGLMPNPKSGTVSNDIAKAVGEAKAGRLEYRTDANGIIHVSIGKTSFKGPDLEQNAQTILSAVRAAKPASLKGTYIRSIYLTSTMGPSIKTDTTPA